jgi:hypothetical protein
MHEHLSGRLSVSITRLATLMSVAMLAACGGESFMGRGVGGQGGQPGAGGVGGGTSGGTGGDTTAVGGAGGSGTGGAGNFDARADGDDSGPGHGIVIITVPFTAPSTGTFFHCPIPASSAMVLGGHTATFSVCVSTGIANPSLYAFQAYATESLSGQGTYGPGAPITTLTTCPAMTAVSLPITNTTVVVNALGLHLSSVATDTDAAAFGTAALEVDSISVSGDPVGPYLFTSDAQGFMAANFQEVPNSMVTWQATT